MAAGISFSAAMKYLAGGVLAFCPDGRALVASGFSLWE
jgi:hypothetical protein